ncbi:MAG: DUF3991 and TOPRIM domain-containing protein [Planctomycetota bacterium]
MATGDEELEEFKTQINLCDYAESQGFVLDRKQSSKSSAVMRHSCGDKIVVARRPSGHWIYFNIHGNDKGSILDFVASRKSLTLGFVRKELRSWNSGRGGGVEPGNLRTAKRSMINKQYDLVPSIQDFDRVNLTWARSRSLLPSDRYLEARGISSELCNDPIFSDRVRIDERNNCIFPHWNKTGQLCGFEIKNHGFTGFAPGGEKGLWCSRPRQTDRIMVVSESAIDAMSVAAIFNPNDLRLFSTAGACSPSQIDCLKSAARKMPSRSIIWLAFDNDESGQEIASEVETELSSIDQQHEIIVKLPTTAGKDWNDVLRHKTRTYGNAPGAEFRSVELGR